MNVNHIKRKIDIEKIHNKNTLDSLQTNCVLVNLLFTISSTCEALQSNFVTNGGVNQIGKRLSPPQDYL